MCAPKPKSEESVKRSSSAVDGSQSTAQYLEVSCVQKNFNYLYAQLDKRTTTLVDQLSTLFKLSYKGRSLNLPAGIAGESAIQVPINEASYFLLT